MGGVWSWGQGGERKRNEEEEEEEEERKRKWGRAIFNRKYKEKEEQDEENEKEFIYKQLHFENLIRIMAGEKESKIYSAKSHQFFPGNFSCVFGQSSSGL